VKYFSHIRVEGGQFEVPEGTGSWAENLVGLLYVEASLSLWDTADCGRSLDDLASMVSLVDQISAKRAAEWAVPMMKSIFEELRSEENDEILSRALEHLGDPNAGHWRTAGTALLAASPHAAELLSDAIEHDIWPEGSNGSFPKAELMAAYGLLFMDGYLEELAEPDHGNQQSREIYLQLAGEALYIAGSWRWQAEAEKAANSPSTLQQQRAARQRDNVKYAPLRQRAIELYRAGQPWGSKRKASIAIVDYVIAFAKESRLYLSPDRAQTTVYEWILAQDK
jgi:hypothetical protein